MSWTDTHNHLQDARLGDPSPIIHTMRKAGIVSCVVNATCEDDWADVENLALDHPRFVLPAFGIHPWHAHTAQPGWQKRLSDLLEKHPHASIGECGLDQWIPSPSIDIQKPVFMDQLDLARKSGRPLTIHCLKAWGPLMAILSKNRPPPRFLMHSFGGSLEIARQLIPIGAYFSFSGYFLHPRKSAVLEVFKNLPRERILLETDAPDMRPPDDFLHHPLPEKLNHPANLPSIGRALAAALEMEPATLAELTSRNASDLFPSIYKPD
jgi:TatD DNase family protein